MNIHLTDFNGNTVCGLKESQLDRNETSTNCIFSTNCYHCQKKIDNMLTKEIDKEFDFSVFGGW